MATEEQINVFLSAAISPLDKKIDHLTTEFAELKRSVEFLAASGCKPQNLSTVHDHKKCSGRP